MYPSVYTMRVCIYIHSCLYYADIKNRKEEKKTANQNTPYYMYKHKEINV